MTEGVGGAHRSQAAHREQQTAAEHKAPGGPDGEPADMLHLGETAIEVRRRLGIDRGLSDDALMSSLDVIARQADRRARWRAAFDSPLGNWLSGRGSDLNTALNTIISLLPPRRF